MSLLSFAEVNWQQFFFSFFHIYREKNQIFLFIEFMGVILVNKIKHFGAQFNNISIHYIVCSSSRVKSPSITIYGPILPSTSTFPPPPPCNHHFVVPSMRSLIFLLLNLSIQPLPSPTLPNSCQPAFYGSILLISSFCLLDPTCE